MNNRRVLGVGMLLLSGCYTTRVYTGAIAAGPELDDRQWFTIGGLVSLSDPAGQTCPAGVARSESQLAGMDILINIGLAIAGGLAGVAACHDQSDDRRAACGSAGATLVPFLLASRTVHYTCAGPATGVPGSWMPAPGQAPPSPYYPAAPAPPYYPAPPATPTPLPAPRHQK